MSKRLPVFCGAIREQANPFTLGTESMDDFWVETRRVTSGHRSICVVGQYFRCGDAQPESRVAGRGCTKTLRCQKSGVTRDERCRVAPTRLRFPGFERWFIAQADHLE